MSTAAITECMSYEASAVEEALKKIAGSSSFPDCRGKKILVKPNILSDSRTETGITTHPAVVMALVRLCQQRGASAVYVGDSPGLPSSSFRAEVCGIAEVCRRTGAIWADFSQNPVSLRLDSKTQVPVAAIIDEVDFVISAAKFKTHQLMYTTGAVKNLFGLIPGLSKSPMHLRFPDQDAFASFLVSLYLKSKTAYSVIDSVIGMEGCGPSNGKLRHVGLLIGSDNAFACDYAQAVIMGYDPADIPVLREGRKRGLIDDEIFFPLLDAENLKLRDFEKIRVSQRKKGLLSGLILPFLTHHGQQKRTRRRPAPVFNSERCIKCARCVRICPAKALSLDKSIEISTDRCIRCYCCAEVCPQDAVQVKA